MSHGIPARTLRAARICLKNCYLLFTGHLNEVVLVDRKTGKQKRVTPDIQLCVERMPFKYSVMLLALGRDQFKREYTKALQVDVPNPCIQSQLAEELKGVHREVIEDIPKQHLCNIAWVASFTETDFDEKKVFNLLHQHKSFETFAEWQLDAFPS